MMLKASAVEPRRRGECWAELTQDDVSAWMPCRRGTERVTRYGMQSDYSPLFVV
jgi:hypothetical protein